MIIKDLFCTNINSFDIYINSIIHYAINNHISYCIVKNKDTRIIEEIHFDKYIYRIKLINISKLSDEINIKDGYNYDYFSIDNESDIKSDIDESTKRDEYNRKSIYYKKREKKKNYIRTSIFYRR